MIEPGHERWKASLLFRDRLRADPTARIDYAQLKRRLALRHGNDRERYTHEKTDFVAKVLAG